MSTYLNIRIEPGLKDELEAEAKRQRRTLSNLTLLAIEKGLSLIRDNKELARVKKAKGPVKE